LVVTPLCNFGSVSNHAFVALAKIEGHSDTQQKKQKNKRNKIKHHLSTKLKEYQHGTPSHQKDHQHPAIEKGLQMQPSPA
jgi:hypothetical protein